jgi:hypothetical protein
MPNENVLGKISGSPGKGLSREDVVLLPGPSLEDRFAPVGFLLDITLPFVVNFNRFLFFQPRDPGSFGI